MTDEQTLAPLPATHELMDSTLTTPSVAQHSMYSTIQFPHLLPHITLSTGNNKYISPPETPRILLLTHYSPPLRRGRISRWAFHRDIARERHRAFLLLCG